MGRRGRGEGEGGGRRAGQRSGSRFLRDGGGSSGGDGLFFQLLPLDFVLRRKKKRLDIGSSSSSSSSGSSGSRDRTRFLCC